MAMSEKHQELDLNDLDKVTGGYGVADAGDLSDSASLELQMAMDKKSKFTQTLSNILKQVGNTASAITGNLK
jgi:hypothetical protein